MGITFISLIIEIGKKMSNTKLSFRQWLAKENSWDGDFDYSDVEYCNKLISKLIEADSHFGYCTQDPCPCSLCLLERLLKEYREYTFSKGVEDVNI